MRAVLLARQVRDLRHQHKQTLLHERRKLKQNLLIKRLRYKRSCTTNRSAFKNRTVKPV